MKDKINSHPAKIAIQGILKSFPDYDITTMLRPEESSEKRLLSTVATMRFLGGVSRMTIWRLCKITGGLTPVWVAGRQMFDLKDLNTYVRRNKKSTRGSIPLARSL